jgi:hypothetical protein
MVEKRKAKNIHCATTQLALKAILLSRHQAGCCVLLWNCPADVCLLCGSVLSCCCALAVPCALRPVPCPVGARLAPACAATRAEGRPSGPRWYWYWYWYWNWYALQPRRAQSAQRRAQSEPAGTCMALALAPGPTGAVWGVGGDGGWCLSRPVPDARCPMPRMPDARCQMPDARRWRAN